ncbi:MAG TPA: PEP-CTERM sorting domain-containing protein [Candidatus Angelobacter sp.]|nr:PEP-CTERM sorting domain-containing protein [Candidatus Angelobacter sp.]
MRIHRLHLFAVLPALLILFATPPARGDSFEVTLNTGPLSGTQTLAFGLTDGDGVVNNTVSFSAFNFGGGVPSGSATDTGSGITGDLSSTVSMSDTGFSSLFSQQFTVGSSLSFLLTTTNNFAGGTPDALALFLCDATISTCYSDDASTGAMLILNLPGGSLSPSSFSLNGAAAQGLSAPIVTPVSTPEPATLPLLAGGLLFATFLRRKKGRNPAV